MTERKQKKSPLASLRDALDQASQCGDNQALRLRRDVLRQAGQRSERRSGRWVLVAASVLLVVGGLGWYVVGPRPILPTPLSLTSNPVATAPLHMKGLVNSASLSPGLRRRMIHFAPTKVVFPEKSALWVAADSTMWVEDAGARQWHLEQGRLLASIEKQHGAQKMRINTAQLQLTVKGTVFAVLAEPTQTTVLLFSGRLEIRHVNGVHRLNAGAKLLVPTEGDAREATIETADMIAALLIAEQTRMLPGPVVPTLTLPIAPPPVRVQQHATQSHAVPPHRRKKKRAGQLDRLRDTDSDAASALQAPPPDEMTVETGNATVAADNKGEEDALQRALEELRSGSHDKGRQMLKDYLYNYPRGKHWHDIENAL